MFDFINVSGYCPYCRANTNITAAPLLDRDECKDRGSKYWEYNYNMYYAMGNYQIFLGKCNKCQEPLMVRREIFYDQFTKSYMDTKITVYPELLEGTLNVEGVPPIILDDAQEAYSNWYHNNYKSAVAMARRVLEEICIDQKSHGKYLVDKINNLPFATPPIKNLANAIRHVGNAGAHADEDEIRTGKLKPENEVSERDADEIIELMELLLKTVYEANKMAVDILSKRKKTIST